MKVLYINASFREGSRTALLAEKVLAEYNRNDIMEIDLGANSPAGLDRERLKKYNCSVASADFTDRMFEGGKEFAEADEIIISAPFWNYTLPAVLHNYLEMVCSQGVTFDMDEKGNYYSKCKAHRLTFITTAGGYIPEKDHAFSYIKDLCEVFWEIKDIRYIKAEGLDIYGTDIDTKLREAIEK